MRFSRWRAAGNDYLLAERAELGEPLTPERVRGEVGDSDGILEVVSADGAEAEIVIWNPDGSTAEMSGNGTRIAAALARRAERAPTRCGSASAPREVVARMLAGGEVEQELGPVEVSSASGSPGSRSCRSRSATRMPSWSAIPTTCR